MGCPGARFLGKKRTSLYVSREKGDHYYISTRHNDLFSRYNLFLGKRQEKLARKERVLQLFREKLSEKVHATMPKGIVGGFEFTVLQRNLQEWHERPWTYVYNC